LAEGTKELLNIKRTMQKDKRETQKDIPMRLDQKKVNRCVQVAMEKATRARDQRAAQTIS
jgi:hypothetical protein